MVNAKLCEMVRLEFFFASPRHVDFLDCKIETSKCFEYEYETGLVESHKNELH